MSLADEAYDVITMWDTIEHFANPADYVAVIARLLRPGGILALTTGDVGSLMARIRGRRWRLYYPPYHAHYFSRRTIALLLRRFGLDVIKISSVGFYRSADLMLYRMLVANKSLMLRGIYFLAKVFRLTQLNCYLNLFDIMFVIARKPGRSGGYAA